MHYGPENLPDADIVISHVDLSIVPASYRKILQDLPVVINQGVGDITKRAYSQNLLNEADPYDGPVIIKTDLNCCGSPERRIAKQEKTIHALSMPLRAALGLKSLKLRGKCTRSNNYWVIPSKTLVPRGLWKDRNFVVEKFLPEREGDLYFMRYYLFLGDREFAGRFGSQEPVVKISKSVTEHEVVEIPEELRALRANMGFDYGRFDFAIHDGKVAIYDVNKTPGGGEGIEDYASLLDELAKGIAFYG